MSRYAAVALCFVLGGCAHAEPGPAPAPAAAPTAPSEPAASAAPAHVGAEQEAEQAALRWLQLVDAGEYRRSWDEGGALFREGVTAEQWDQALRQARTPLGAVSRRTLQQAQRMTQLPGAPEGEYVVLIFDAQYAAGAMREQVVMERETDGQWRSIGYFVQP